MSDWLPFGTETFILLFSKRQYLLLLSVCAVSKLFSEKTKSSSLERVACQIHRKFIIQIYLFCPEKWVLLAVLIAQQSVCSFQLILNLFPKDIVLQNSVFLTLFHQGGGGSYLQTCIPVKNQWVEILMGVLRELNSKPIFEQVTPSRSSGKQEKARRQICHPSGC